MKRWNSNLNRFRHPVGRSLEEQYNIVFNIVRKHKPEWCFYMTLDDGIEEFHHQLWDLPFYKMVYHVDSQYSFFKKEDLYCKVEDPAVNSLNLFHIRTWKVSKVLHMKPKVVEKTVELRNGNFENIFDKIVKSEQNFYENPMDGLPDDIKDKFAFGVLVSV